VETILLKEIKGRYSMKKEILLSLSLISTTLISVTAIAAPKVNPSNVPLETGVGSLVKPNLMFIFDESLSMDRDYLGDEANGANCKTQTGPIAAVPDTYAVKNWTTIQPKTFYSSQAVCEAAMPPSGTQVGETAYRCGKDVLQYSQCTSMGDNGCLSYSPAVWTDYFMLKGPIEVIPGKAAIPEGRMDAFNRACSSSYSTAGTALSKVTLSAADGPFAAYQFNKQYYNPNVVYQPGVKYDGTSYGDQSITSAKGNVYTSGTSYNLTTTLKEIYFCNKSSPTATEISNTNICKRNGIDTPNPFDYYTEAYPDVNFRYAIQGPSPKPFYYEIIPSEYCDESGVNCAAIQNAYYPIPFPVRWCTSHSNAMPAGVVSGAGRCRANYGPGYGMPRYGKFKRVEIPSSQYTNFANWFTYYRTRLLATKTATGLAFIGVDSSKRVGLISLNNAPASTAPPTTVYLPGSEPAPTTPTEPAPATPSNVFLPVGEFTTAGGTTSHKANFYSKLYGLISNGDTDLKKTLSQVGRYYAGISSGISANMINGTTSKDPVQYSCQQNFALLATDGYWNPGTFGKDLGSTNIANIDNVNSSSNYSLRIDGVYDGGLAGSTGTLSDVALYYYKTPLRSSSLGNCMTTSSGTLQNLCESNVPISPLDQNPNQHMVTYAMSLGLSGLMKYTKDYTYGTSTDLQNVKNGTIGACPWISGATGVCNWPVPAGNDPASLDDLWHATLSGRGKYFSAKDSSEAISGLQDALTSVSAQTGSSAAAATSSPNITATDNALFYVTYRTAKWDGEINATTIDPATGIIAPTSKWSARTLLNGKVAASTDTRNIYYVRNGSGTSELKSFAEANMTISELNNFKDKCVANDLTQCGNLNPSNKTKINAGSALITYLRGQSFYDVNNPADPLFRPREYVLGDIVNSSPVYVSKPNYAWADAGYATFASSNVNRSPTLYVGANDGMIHAFDAVTGQERWAVIPSQMMSKLYKLADTSYATSHDFFVDGTISVMDAKINGTWKTVLIAGMNSGGKGYIALDITNPTTPTVLWEACNTSACSVVDSEFGYSYGNPIITKRKSDGKWVAYLSSGYDNSSAKGLIYEVDLADGTILRKLYTGTGDSGDFITPYTQSGIAKINASYSSFNQDNTALNLYAGDLDGRVWKWDLNNTTQTTAIALGRATDPLGIPQPITTKIEIGRINNNIVLFAGTGKFLSSSDYTTTQINSVYAFKDNGSSYGNFRNNISLVKQTLTPGAITTTGTNMDVDLASKNGWYFDLTSQLGERVNVEPVLALGVLNLVTNIPGSSACSAGGNAWMYQIDFATGTAVDQVNGFIAKKLDAGLIVGQSIVQLGQFGGLKNYLTDASGKVITVSVPTGKKNSDQKLKKYFWKEVQKR
jgi:type IV pilus assembly protein PilY1